MTKNGHPILKRCTGERRPSGSYYYDEVYLRRHILPPSKGMEICHLNEDKTDCRRANLDEVPHAYIVQRGGPRTGHYKGVHWNKRRNKWVAQITINYRMKTIGAFDDEHHAASAYNAAALRFFGAHAYQNVLPEDRK